MKHRKQVKVNVTPISLVNQYEQHAANFKRLVESNVYIPSENAVYRNFENDMKNAKRTP